jgi:hypothetical protein
MSDRKHWTLTAVAIGFIIVAFCVWFGFKVLDDAIRVPRGGLTQTTMMGIQRRMFIYIHQQGKLPERLDQLPNLPDHYNSINDGWRNPIQYSVDQDGVVTLKSFGPGGRSGGTNGNEYIIRSFQTRDSGGNWLTNSLLRTVR